MLAVRFLLAVMLFPLLLPPRFRQFTRPLLLGSAVIFAADILDLAGKSDRENP